MKRILILVVLGVLAGCNIGSHDTDRQKAEQQDAPAHESKGNAGIEITEADLGVPFYPGSTPVGSGSVKTQIGGQWVIGNMRGTNSSPKEVIDFYKSALMKAGYAVTTILASSTVGSVTGKKGDSDTITCNYTSSASNSHVIAITRIQKKR